MYENWLDLYFFPIIKKIPDNALFFPYAGVVGLTRIYKGAKQISLLYFLYQEIKSAKREKIQKSVFMQEKVSIIDNMKDTI